MKVNERYTSIVIASFIPDELRAKMFRTSLDSLLETTKDLPVEIIIVDNGGDEALTAHLMGLTADGYIQCLVRNANNMHFGFGRNQGIKMAKGQYLVIADNDILYEPGWLEECWEVLEAHPKKKIYATPIEYPTGVMLERYHVGELNGMKLSSRAGSNCFVIRRSDFDKIGTFLNHRIAGSRWTDKAVRAGYSAVVIGTKKAKDMGLRNGYNLGVPLPVKRTLRNGEEVYFNHDEFKIPS